MANRQANSTCKYIFPIRMNHSTPCVPAKWDGDILLLVQFTSTPVLFTLSSEPADEYIAKPVLNDHSNIDKTQILMTNGSLMKVKSI